MTPVQTATAPLARTVTALRCRACGTTTDVGPVHVCSECFGPLEVVLDPAVAAGVTRAAVADGPRSIWRYAPLLPVVADGPVPDDLGAGFTPLVPAPRLARELGLGELWLKDDTRNPSGSFKDRVVAVALAAARAFGMDTLACASTGNLANAVAAHAAQAGLRAVVFVPDDLEEAKLLASAVYGATLVAVRGTYDQVNRLCAELADQRGWGFVNINLRPYYAEGSKTLGFEVAEQLGWQLPDHVVVPIASGAQLVQVAAAFRALTAAGLVPEHPVRLSGAQAAGCAPVAAAFQEGRDDIHPVKPHTIARSLAIGDPADGAYALRAVRDSGGAIGAVTDEEIRAGMRLLARTEGIFAETAGGVTVATLRNLARAGIVRPDERVVAMITGHGLKTVAALAGHLPPPLSVPPSLAAVEAVLDGEPHDGTAPTGRSDGRIER